MPDHQSRNRRRKVAEDNSESEDEEDDRVLYFVPSQDIDIEVLVYYLRRYLGNDSDAEPGQHPKDPRRMGYFVKSRLGLSTAMMKDLKEDSTNWTSEKKGTSSRKERRIRYEDSKTASRRADLGPSGEPSDPPGRPGRAASVKPEIYAPTPRPILSNTIQRRDSDMLGSGGYAPIQSSVRTHQDPIQGQNPTPQQWNPTLFSQQEGYAMNYTSQTPAQGRSGPAYNTNILVNANFQSNPNRHTSPGAQNVLPSFEERTEYAPLAPPPYDGKGGNQPATTGSHGFTSINPTAPAPSRHNKR